MSRLEGLIGRYADFLVNHSKAIVILVLVLTLVVASGAVVTDAELRISQFQVDSAEETADSEIRSQFPVDEHSFSQIVIRSNDDVNDTVLKENLLETLELQQEIRSNETVNKTLAAQQPTLGVGNAIAIATDPRIGFDGSPPIALQIGVLEDRTDHQNKRVLGLLLDDPSSTPEGQPPVSSLLEKGYDPGNDTADARLIIVVHNSDATETELVEAQQTIETLANESVTAETFVFGQELAFDRGSEATAESFQLIGPLILVVVFLLLILAYRDLLDVLLSGFGIALVLLWTAGFTGWLGIEFTQLLVAVPCLLVGLSLDYSLHVVMRYREEKTADPAVSVDQAMARGLAGVLLALIATTATTAAGFFSGVISPISILRDFGVVAALGVVSTLIVFGAFVPAAKLEGERWRQKTDPSPRRSVGSLGFIGFPLRYLALVTGRVPFIVIGLAVILAVGGAVGATTVDTSTDRADFLPEEPPAWMEQLPEQLRPTDNGIQQKAIFIDETFESPREPTVDILIRGNITDGDTLTYINESAAMANDSAVSVQPRDGTNTVDSPLDAVESAAETSEEAEAIINESDTNGDGIPDQNLAGVYDAVYDAIPETANETINRTETGEYQSLRMTITINESANKSAVTREMRKSAAVIDETDSLEAIATGGPILEYIQERAILETVLGTLLLALAVITAILTVLFKREHQSWTLGAVTIMPVLLSIAWLIGTLSVLSIPYNAETALLTAIAIGLGTDYTIHITERFIVERQERTRTEALRRTVVETGGVVVASALTTGAAFLVLLLTVVPSLQRFGFVTGLAVFYAAIASLTVLPSLLVLWDRYRSRFDQN